MNDDSAANRLATRSYEQFEHAYKTGYNSFLKYPGQNFDDVEDDIALGYEEAKPGSALPWDTVVPAVNAVWDRLGGIISPARSQPRRARVALAK
jgi:hypothetical protein